MNFFGIFHGFMSRENAIPENRVDEIFRELKAEQLIQNDRTIKSKHDLKNIRSHFLEGKILFDPKIALWSDTEIRFGLLHEEGHIVRGHCGSFLKLLLAIVGFFLSVGGVLLITILLNQNFGIMLVGFGTFLLIFCTRLSSKPLEMDEFTSDEFAAEILKNEYNINKPSEILKSVLDKIQNFQKESDTSKRKDSPSFYKLIKISFTEDCYPLDQQRVANIIFLFDERQ
jgi:Zn-dependent protease with chaperone function